MMTVLNNRIARSVTVFAAFTLFSCGIFGAQSTGEHGEDDRVRGFYRGMEEQPLYSKSYIAEPHTKFTFNPVLQGDTINHDFMIRNEGKDPIDIEKVEAG